MFKAFFIAPTYKQASYWADQWGYSLDEIEYVPASDWTHLLGYDAPDQPAFICGDEFPKHQVWNELIRRGFNVFDAQDLA